MEFKGKRILIIDDEIIWSKQHRRLLENEFEGCIVQEENSFNYEEIKNSIYQFSPHCILLDIRGNKTGEEKIGFEICRKIRKDFGELIPIVFMTAYSDENYIIEGLKQGANDYIDKAQRPDLRAIRIKTWLRIIDLISKNEKLIESESRLKEKVDSKFVYSSSKIGELIKRVEKIVTRSDGVILLYGETGTGKEVIAREIGKIAKKKIVSLNCAAIPETLMESALFGYEKGAFTGAYQTKKGVFEEAKGKILFLDEIGDMPPSMQLKLLRALQEKQIKRLGGVEEIDVSDVRLVCATHKNLEKLVESEEFRKDLYFRINVHKIDIPPLRERKEDIKILANHFVNQYNLKYNLNIVIDPKAEEALENYNWPGNVRELEHCIMHLCVEVDDVITLKSLLEHFPQIGTKNISKEETSKDVKSSQVKSVFTEPDENEGLEIWRKFHFRRVDVAKYVQSNELFKKNPFLDTYPNNCSNKLKTIYLKGLVEWDLNIDLAVSDITKASSNEIEYQKVKSEMEEFFNELKKTFKDEGREKLLEKLKPFCRKRYSNYAEQFLNKIIKKEGYI